MCWTDEKVQSRIPVWSQKGTVERCSVVVTAPVVLVLTRYDATRSFSRKT